MKYTDQELIVYASKMLSVAHEDQLYGRHRDWLFYNPTLAAIQARCAEIEADQKKVCRICGMDHSWQRCGND